MLSNSGQQLQNNQRRGKNVGFIANTLYGSTYSVRALIRGARKTGKSQLFNILQGHPFSSKYIPTPSISCASINMDLNGFYSFIISSLLLPLFLLIIISILFYCNLLYFLF